MLPKITRFKQDFLNDLQLVFHRLVDVTEPICQAINPAKAAMTIFDSSGIEAWVTENNPKYANRIIKQLKAYAKAMHFDGNYDPYKAAYSFMFIYSPQKQRGFFIYYAWVLRGAEAHLSTPTMK